MFGSIETIHNKIITKIDTLLEIASSLKLNKIHDNITELDMTYNMRISAIMNQYYGGRRTAFGKARSSFQSIDRSTLYGSYKATVVSENIIGQMDEYFRDISRYIKDCGSERRGEENITKLIQGYERNRIVFKVQRNMEFDKCESCDVKMVTLPDISELCCPNCGETRVLYGTIFEDSQIYNQDRASNKSGGYDPDRHCLNWLKRIQAKDTKSIPKEHVEKVRQCAIRAYTRIGPSGKKTVRDMSQMKCWEIREWLKESRLAKYYNHAPLIRKILTGVVPCQLTFEEEQQIRMMFSKAMRVFDILMNESARDRENSNKRQNKLYYPYGLFKIIESKFPRGHPKRALLECIHLQSRETVIKNDKIWSRICDRINSKSFKYIDTDRNMEF